jgi:ABC-type Fe3+ transport system permease subunit
MKYAAIIPALIAAAFAVRAFLLRTFASRQGIERQRASARPAVEKTRRQRLAAAAAWPVFLVMVAAILVLSVLLGSILGPH